MIRQQLVFQKKRKVDSVGLVCFQKLPLKIKQSEMLKWLVNEELAMLAINANKLISESDVECIPERVPSAIILLMKLLL